MIGALKLCRWALPILTMLCIVPGACALDPNRLMSQYVRQQWNADRGIPVGHVVAIAQTADGYLWMGTDNGLVRFDGFTFQPVSFSPVGLPSNSTVLGLVVDAEGSLVIRLAGTVVLRKSNGSFTSLSSELGLTASYVTAMWKEENGGVLFSDLVSGTVRFHGKKVEVLARPSGLPGAPLVTSLAETPDGKIWMGTLGAGLFYATQGQVTRVMAGLPDRKVNCMLSGPNNEMWVGTDKGLFHWNGRALTRGALPSRLDDLQILTLLRDRQSNIWAGTSRGLLRVNANGVSISEEPALGATRSVHALFEDREGNLWVGGTNGLERIRDSAFVSYSKTTGLPSERNGPIYADAENRIWAASTDGGLYRLANGRHEGINQSGLAKDEVYSIAGQNGDIWVGRQHDGLTHLLYHNAVISAQTYTERNGLAQNSIYAVYQSYDGAVWTGTLSAGVSRFKDGRFVTYNAASGLASNTVNSILETRDETMWFATANGLSSFVKGQWRTFTTLEGLPSATVDCLLEDSAGVLWAGTSAGLAFLSAGRVQVPNNMPESLRGQVFGIAEDKKGWFWIATADHVLAVQRDKLIAGGIEASDLREFGGEDGLLSTEGVKRNRSVISDPAGRIWFSLARGLSVTDPSHLAHNSAPAITHIAGIFADGAQLGSQGSIHVPASRKRITLAYTGLSLAAPERVRFRYLLEGFDRTWSEPVSGREAVYTNLNAGQYRFRLVACNSDGLWNGAETSVQFEIDPVFWKTWWFGLASTTVFLGILWALHQVRLRKLHYQFNLALEARVDERTRIARELHDTLLQGLHGLMFQFQAARNMLPNRPMEAVQTLDGAITATEQAIAESRDAIHDLRTGSFRSGDLAEAIRAAAQELADSQPVDSRAPAFQMVVEGDRKPLPLSLRDEVYRIAHEILRNAFQHANAGHIEVEIRYDAQMLRLRIRDDGRGLTRKTLREGGTSGHWGLRGIRERAERIGAQVDFWSEAEAGTEVQLTIPASVAYEASRDTVGSKLFGKVKNRARHS